ncbi:hypothetical protein KR026_006425, partial [Drosophila bipectinata]
DGTVLRFSNFECQSYNKSMYIVNNCRLKAVSRDRIEVHYNGALLRPAHKVKLHLKVYKRESGYKPWLLETTVDACRFLRKNYNPLAKLLYRTVQEFTNMNHTCPYEVSPKPLNLRLISVLNVPKQGEQIVKGYYVKPELIVLPFPTGTYMLAMRWFFNQKHQLDTNLTYEFIEDLIKS